MIKDEDPDDSTEEHWITKSQYMDWNEYWHQWTFWQISRRTPPWICDKAYARSEWRRRTKTLLVYGCQICNVHCKQNQHMPFQETHSMSGILQEESKYLHRLPVWSTNVHTPYTWTTASSKDRTFFGPRSLTGIYLGKDTIHGKATHIIVTSTQNGTVHYKTQWLSTDCEYVWTLYHCDRNLKYRIQWYKRHSWQRQKVEYSSHSLSRHLYE